MRPFRGSALVMDLPARHARSFVGVVAHASYLYEELTALENLRFYAELYDVHAPVRRAAELLERVGLEEVAHERVGRLSRGQQQRVTLARALLHDPALLLLDEPDTGLDVAAWRTLAELLIERGRTVVLTTHNLSAGLEVATRVAVLAHGGLVHDSTTAGQLDAAQLSTLLQQLARE